MLFWDIISISSILFTVFPVILYFTTMDTMYISMTIGLIACIICVHVAKHIINQKRPLGAKGCDILNKDVSNEHELGMPSGHVATVAFVFSFLFLSISGKIQKTIIGVTGLISVILMGMSRYYKHCHSLEQVCFGVLTGLLFGFMTQFVHVNLVDKLGIYNYK